MVRPRSCQIIYYFDTPALGRRHQSFGRISFPTCFLSKLSLSNVFFNIDLVENLALNFPACFFLFFSFCFCFFFFPKLASSFFFLFFFFFRIVFVDFIFLILNWLRIWFCSFFLYNIVDYYNVSSHDFFFMIYFVFFSRIVLVDFIFFHIKLIENLAS